VSDSITPAIVLDLDVNGLGVVRALGRASVPVIGLYSERFQVGRYSRYCKSVALPSSISSDALVQRLVTLAQELGQRAVLFATTDAYADFVNAHREVLKKHFLFHSTDRGTFTQLNSKLGIIALAKEHNIPTPLTQHFSGISDFDRELDRLQFPMIIKPVDTFQRHLPDQAKNVVFHDSTSLRGYVQSHADYLPNMIFQQLIPGGDGHIIVCTLLLDHQGRPVMWYTGRKLRQYPPDYGVTSFGVSEIRRDVASMSIRFMQAVGYHGLCTLEFAEAPDHNECLFLEVNLRSYYHNQLFCDCGLNFPLVELSLLTGRPVSFTTRPIEREGVHWLDFNRDLGTFYRKRRAGQAGFWHWLLSLRRARSFAVFALDDLKPWLHRCTQLLRILRQFLGRVTGSQAQ
jgi:predicted ATP-grasp superfamily ATP-dependent carboligase